MTDRLRRAAPFRLRAAALLPALLLAGCAIVHPKAEWATPATDATPVQLAGVPFHAQTRYQCGPAALASLLGASGVETSPERLEAQVFLPERRGSLQVELLAASRRAGRVPMVIPGELDVVLAELHAGRPVLVLQNLLTPQLPYWHYAVVVGADPARDRLYLHTGRKERKAVRAGTFQRTWDWGGRWAMVALRPGELPAGGDALRYLDAVAAFEAVAGARAAEPAYRAAARRWPEDPRVRLALGNLAYGAGDKAAAARQFRDGLARAPQDAVLANNLASVLGELGCPRAGEAVLAPIAAGLSPEDHWRENVERTLAELAGTPRADPPRCADL